MVSKYRAWDKKTKRMSEVKLIDCYSDVAWLEGIVERGIRFTAHRKFDDIILMQSTELFDKNGIEIFEGDVVTLHRFVLRYSSRGGAYEDEEELIGVIVHEHLSEESVGKVYPRQWGLKVNGDVLYFSLLEGLHEESFQAIGNIYENTELLEGENDKV